MTIDRFWELIEKSLEGIEWPDDDKQEANLFRLLSDLELEDLYGFKYHFGELTWSSYSWELWGVAQIINEGCSDDGFDYFRFALISAGREHYTNAMKDPESLVDWCPGCMRFEGISYVPSDVFEFKTKLDADEFYRRLKEYEKGLPTCLVGYPEPTGVNWEEKDLPTRFPRVWAKWGED